MKKKVVVVLSGGMDSTTLLYYCYMHYNVVGAITFDYGQKHKKEIEYAKYHCKTLNIPHKIVELNFIKDIFKSNLLEGQGDIPEGHYEENNMKQTVVPFRNGIMLSIAAGYAESIDADKIAIANHAGDHAIYPDCRKSFIHFIKMAIQTGTWKNIQVLAPFTALKKQDIVAIGHNLKVPYNMTWSCYKGKDKHCGKCGTCTERKEAFKLAKVEDPTEYA